MRNHFYLINDILKHVPDDQPLFIGNLRLLQRMYMQSPPENNKVWFDLHKVIEQYIPYPSEHWEFIILSLVSGVDIVTLKESDNLPVNW